MEELMKEQVNTKGAYFQCATKTCGRRELRHKLNRQQKTDVDSIIKDPPKCPICGVPQNVVLPHLLDGVF